MTRKQTTSKKYSRRASSSVASLVLAAVMTLAASLTQSCNHKQITQTTANNQVETPKEFQNVEVVSVYDGDTFTINLNCTLKVMCEKVSVRVRGVDTPEIKGKTEREKALAQQAKAFTQNFLKQKPILLNNCGRDKYFRLLCNVSNKTGKDLGEELIQAGLGYSYQGGTKSTQFQ